MLITCHYHSGFLIVLYDCGVLAFERFCVGFVSGPLSHAGPRGSLDVLHGGGFILAAALESGNRRESAPRCGLRLHRHAERRCIQLQDRKFCSTDKSCLDIFTRIAPRDLFECGLDG